jgi:uncharacterized protein
LIAYLDASALVKRYVEEAQSAEVRRILAECIPATSRLTEVEIVSAIARRCREGDISIAIRDAILAQLRDDMPAFYVVEVVPEVVSSASALLMRHPLRANDAIQLASCLVVQTRLAGPVRFVAFDQRLVAAAQAEGLLVETAAT